MKDKIIEALKQVYDPELNLDVYKLGLIYDININADKVSIVMTLTSPMCPFGDMLINNVKDNIGKVEGVKEVNVDLVFEPLWQPSDELKLELGIE